MTEVVARLSHCPYCRRRVSTEERVEVVDDSSLEPLRMTEGLKPDFSKEYDYDTIECVRFEPCGHALNLEDVKEIASSVRELSYLREELETCTDSDRIRELKEYEIPAKENEINRYSQRCERIEKAEGAAR